MVFGQKFEREGVRPHGTVISATEFAGLGCRPEAVTVGMSTYYRCAGAWYQNIEHEGWTCYAEIYPPAGARLGTLPHGSMTLNSDGGRTYYATDDAIYVSEPGTGYVVVEPPAGTRFDRLPATAKKSIPVVVNGTSYYRHLGVFYREESSSSGDSYVVTSSPFLANPGNTATAAAATTALTPVSAAAVDAWGAVSAERHGSPHSEPSLPGSPRSMFLRPVRNGEPGDTP